MAAVTYPGVYIDELPAGVRRIDGVQTSTAAFVGSGGDGPCDQPIHVHALADFERAFGQVAETDPVRLAVQLFFANQEKAKKLGADQDFLNNIGRGVGVGNFNVEQWQRDMNEIGRAHV